MVQSSGRCVVRKRGLLAASQSTDTDSVRGRVYPGQVSSPLQGVQQKTQMNQHKVQTKKHHQRTR